jgi:enediyne biosynthesis protein E4
MPRSSLASRTLSRAAAGARAPRSSTTIATTTSTCSSRPTSTCRRARWSATARSATTARDYCSPRAYRHTPDRLLRNDGDGTFTDVSEAAGITKADGAGLGISTGDYNGDGWPDLYVANDATPNQLWINQKNGTFVDMGPVSGAAVNAAGNPEGSMGIASGDYDADGDEDLFITNIIGETYALYVNNGRADFDDSRVKAGLAQPTAAFTGFGTDWFDADNDGWLDLFIANGAVNVIEAQRGDPFPFRMRNQLFRNLGTGRFEEIAAGAAGPAFTRAEVNRGAAFGDVDNDGDVDILVTTNNGPVRLLLNQTLSTSTTREAAARPHWLALRVEQPAPRGNRFAVGARIGIERAGQPTLWRRVRSDGSYLSASDLRVHVGLGSSARVDAITVEWPGVRAGGPGSSTERWTNVQVDRLLTLRRGTGK